MEERKSNVVIKRSNLMLNEVTSDTSKIEKLMKKDRLTKEEKAKFDEINEDYGNALRLLEYPDSDVLGRENEINALSVIMNRPKTPVAIIRGDAGTGKTSMVETWFRRINIEKDNCTVVALSIGQLSADEPTLKKRLTGVFNSVFEFQKTLRERNKDAFTVLFIDEIHTAVSTFGQSKIGGDILKEVLAKPPIRVITATTDEEYEKYISTDNPFARRFKPITLNEIPSELTLNVLRHRLEVDCHEDAVESKKIADTVTEETLKEVVISNKLYREQYKEPAKSIDVIETMIGRHVTFGEKMDRKMVHHIFKDQYDIELDFKANVDHVFEVVQSRVKGQPLALASIKTAIQRISFQLERTNKARATLLLTGSTGVGKTEMAKSLSVGIYGTEESMKFFNMPDYGLAQSEPVFRRDLGRHLSRYPSCIVLLDELEKADESIRKGLLSILDEGIVTYNKIGADGFEATESISLRNSIIVATTNAGANMYKTQNQYSKANDSVNQENRNEVTDELVREFRRTEPQVREALMSEGFAPELLNRFQSIVPFKGLSEATLIEISEKMLQKKCELIKERGLEIKFNKPMDWTEHGYPYTANEVAMFVAIERASQDDTNSGGARAIHRFIENDFMSAIYDALSKYPDETKFLATTNGKAQFESTGMSSGSGEIVIQPMSFT